MNLFSDCKNFFVVQWRNVQIANRPDSESSKVVAKRPGGEVAKKRNVLLPKDPFIATQLNSTQVLRCVAINGPLRPQLSSLELCRYKHPLRSSANHDNVSSPCVCNRTRWQCKHYTTLPRCNVIPLIFVLYESFLSIPAGSDQIEIWTQLHGGNRYYGRYRYATGTCIFLGQGCQ